MRAAGVVLCGGRSSRMGRPKAWLSWRGRPLLVHVVEQLRRARDAGQDISAELNPWALFLGNDWNNIVRLGSYALSYYIPEKNTQPLWDALADGTIDIISTDHGPHTKEEKEPGWTDGWKAHTGTPSAQFYVPLFLGAAVEGLISLERVVDLIATQPAKRFGLGRKGAVEPGRDADIAIVNLDTEFEITDDIVLSKIGYTPYAGQKTKAAVETTLVRGKVVFEAKKNSEGLYSRADAETPAANDTNVKRVAQALVGTGFEDVRPAMAMTKDRKSTRLNSSHMSESRMPSSA